MIVVMPNGNATQTVSQGFGFGPTPARQSVQAPAPPPVQAAQPRRRGAGPGGGRGGTPQPYAGSYPESLVKDVIPFVEKRFRVLAAKDDRAIAGLSMGGGHTVAATNNNPGRVRLHRRLQLRAAERSTRRSRSRSRPSRPAA